MDLVFAGKLIVAGLAAIIRWRATDARNASLVYLGMSALTMALMPDPKTDQIGVMWYWLCALIEGGTILLVLLTGRNELTRLLSYALGACVIINIVAAFDYRPDYLFFYDYYPALIMLGAAFECACLLVCSAQHGGLQTCRKTQAS